jgi:hypothetical protein
MVHGRRFRSLFAKSWAAAFPELPASRALVARLEGEKASYEEALAAGMVESAELQRVLMAEVIADNAAGFAAPFGVRNPTLGIFLIVCRELPVWEVLDCRTMALADFVLATGARKNIASTLLVGHVGALGGWDNLCDAPKALPSGQVEWADVGLRTDLSSLTKAPAMRVLFLGHMARGAGLRLLREISALGRRWKQGADDCRARSSCSTTQRESSGSGRYKTRATASWLARRA